LSNSQSWLKEYLKHNMIDTGISKIDCPLFKITLRKTTKIVEVDDETELDAKYKVIVPESYSVDKRLLLADLKIGDVTGARLVDGKQGLLIK
jgi:hypothetical protein